MREGQSASSRLAPGPALVLGPSCAGPMGRRASRPGGNLGPDHACRASCQSASYVISPRFPTHRPGATARESHRKDGSGAGRPSPQLRPIRQRRSIPIQQDHQDGTS